MYGAKHQAAAVVLPATGLGIWSESAAVVAVVLIVTGLIVVVRNLRSKHRP